MSIALADRSVAHQRNSRYTKPRMVKRPKRKSMINKLRNADFSAGRTSPIGWVFRAGKPAVSFARDTSNGIVLRSQVDSARGELSQSVSCKPGKSYRVECDIVCDLKPTPSDGGFRLGVEFFGDPDSPRRIWAAPVITANSILNVRMYAHAREHAKALKINLSLENAIGAVTILEARVIQILTPEEESHPLAMPPPWFLHKKPRACSKVRVVSSDSRGEAITEILRVALGKSAVSLSSQKDWSEDAAKFDAHIFLHSTPPRGIRRLQNLVDLARDRVVIISLPAFAAIAGSAVKLRRVEQKDDPIHARVDFSAYPTAGFALHDAFPYAWSGRTRGSFVQQHFRGTPELRSYCVQNQFEVLLSSMCDKESTSYQPIALFRATDAGALFVIDLDPLCEPCSTFGEINLAARLLLAMLGHIEVGLGQFALPPRSEETAAEFIWEAERRLDTIVVHTTNGAATRNAGRCTVAIGEEDHSYGLPMVARPILMLRSGLNEGEFESVNTAWIWLKQLLRAEPQVCPYAETLLRRFRPAWLPIAATIIHPMGSKKENARRAVAIESPSLKKLGALVDVVAAQVDQPRIILHEKSKLRSHFEQWLPRLWNAVGPQRHFTYGPTAQTEQGRYLDYKWHWRCHTPELAFDSNYFHDPMSHFVLETGGETCRVEFPGGGPEQAARSIERSDLAATCIELTVGMLLGLVAVNRRYAKVNLQGHGAIEPGGAVALAR